MTDQADTMRVLRPAPHVFAFYDGRIPGKRLHGPQLNWLDDGGYTLGTCSYAIVDGAEALVYDTHMTLDHGRRIYATLKAEGVTVVRVVLSHHHRDHIAGNEAFADCEIVANAATAAAMAAKRADAETADPPIRPVVIPNLVFGTEMDLTVGSITVALRSYDIHSHDGLVMWLPETRQLFAGDTLEDTVTYVAEPGRLETHLAELDRLAELDIARILPNHGAEDIIASGGYGPRLIGANAAYLRSLLQCRADAHLAAKGLKDFIADEIAAGVISYHPAYEAVHRWNVQAVLGA